MKTKLMLLVTTILITLTITPLTVFATNDESDFKFNASTGTITEYNGLPTDDESDFEFNASTGTITDYNGSSKDVVIPSSINGVPVTTIGKAAFTMDILESVSIPDTVIVIDDRAFNDNKIKKIIIPDSVKTIGEDAFANNNISSLTLGSSVESIGSTAFKNNNISKVEFPYSLNYMGSSAFEANPIGRVSIKNLPLSDTISSGAKGEVKKAVDRNIVPIVIQKRNYKDKITVEEFCLIVQKMFYSGDVELLSQDYEGIFTKSQLNKYITREQAVAYLMYALDHHYNIHDFNKIKTVNYINESSISPSARDAVKKAVNIGVLSVSKDNTFKPKENYTIEQSVILVNRLYSYINTYKKENYIKQYRKYIVNSGIPAYGGYIDYKIVGNVVKISGVVPIENRKLYEDIELDIKETVKDGKVYFNTEYEIDPYEGSSKFIHSYWAEMVDGEGYFMVPSTYQHNLKMLNQSKKDFEKSGAINTSKISQDVKNKAKEITKTAKTDYDKAAMIYRWVECNITYGPGSSNPSTVLKNRVGVCEGYASLTAEMLKAVGIKAKVVSGTGEGYPHGWTEAYIDGRVVIMDNTLGWWVFDYDLADFSEDHITLNTNYK